MKDRNSLRIIGGTLFLMGLPAVTGSYLYIYQPQDICYQPYDRMHCAFTFPGTKSPLPEPTTNYQGTTMASSLSSTASPTLQGFDGILDVSSFS